MARLFGLIGNRSDLAGRVLAHESDALIARSGGAQLGWGMGFYQGGERVEQLVDFVVQRILRQLGLGHLGRYAGWGEDEPI